MAIDKITTPAIADGAVSADTLTSTVITGQTAETSIATDDLILLSDTSASGALKKMTRANFVSGIGGTMTPAFEICLNSAQTISSLTATKVALDNARIDTASSFDATNDRWVVPSGQGGKYFVSYQVFGDSGAANNLLIVEGMLRINGSNSVSSIIDFRDNGGRMASTSNSAILSLNATDYIELWGTIYDTTGSPQFGGGSSGAEAYKSHITGYKIIE